MMKFDTKRKNILAIFTIPIFGFILLNLTFLFAFLVHSALNLALPRDKEMVAAWIPLSRHLIFLLIILVISFFIFRAKMFNDLLKAIYSVVPMAVVLVTAGLILFRWPIAVYSVCAVIVALVVFYLFKTRKSWIFYYAIGLVSLALLIMTVLGVDI